MNPTLAPLPQLAALPLALMAAALAGCPDTSVDAGASGGDAGHGPVGKLTLVQTIVAADDPDVSLVRDFVLSPDDRHLYVATWAGQVLTFDRDPGDGSLERVSALPLFNGFGLGLTPDGEHLYAAGNNTPDQVEILDVDPVTGEPEQKLPSVAVASGGFELAVAGDGAWLFQSLGGIEDSLILSYRIHPTTGALTAGSSTPHDSQSSNFTFFVDDEHHTLFAERVDTTLNKHIVRYAVDDVTGALTQQADTIADLWFTYATLALCPGTTRLYVPQETGNVGYADVSGTGLSIPSSFAHPDLAHARGAALSPDCRNLYVVTQQASNGSLVVLARDDAGDLSWLQTIPMGPGTALYSITEPWYPRVSADGKSVYMGSWRYQEGLVVLARDTTGALLP